MSYFVTAAALVKSLPGNLKAADDIARRMTTLLEHPPADRGALNGSQCASPPQAFLGQLLNTDRYDPQRLLRVEVSADLDRLDDADYKGTLVEDARRAAYDFIQQERNKARALAALDEAAVQRAATRKLEERESFAAELARALARAATPGGPGWPE